MEMDPHIDAGGNCTCALRGERLSDEDRAVYDATRHELEDNETLQLFRHARQREKNCANWSCNVAGWKRAARNSTRKLLPSSAISRRKPGNSLAQEE